MIAKSEWRGGDQKKMEKMEFDMPTDTDTSYLSQLEKLDVKMTRERFLILS